MRLVNIRLCSKFKKDNLNLYGILVILGRKAKKRDDIKLKLEDNRYDIKFYFNKIKNIPILSRVFNLYKIEIPIEDLLIGNIHKKACFVFKNKRGKEKRKKVRYSLFGRERRYKNGKIKIIEESNNSIYIRQSCKNQLIITTREINVTDSTKEQLKLNLAYFLSKFIIKRKILMYEKHSEKYEESASVLYERLIDEGNKNVYYIIDKNNSKLKEIKDVYKKNFIYKYTFKHYLAFFSAKALIGTESPGHAIELRTANKYVARRIYNDNFKYVFLQHGVMYMVSLDSSGRSFFRKNGGMPKNSKVVVSSQKEANHFIELGGFNQEDLYITGLPKYDKNKLNEKADKIVIMFTWRPWEYNTIRNDIYKSMYYSIINNVIEAIPEELKDKIILMPHPLVVDFLRDSNLNKYILKKFQYDEVLKNTKVLITDYSSIAYDAFYRGSNVVFYWEQKDYCMEQYKGHLMLNDDNAFGEICYNIEDLKEIIAKEYYGGQQEDFKSKYKEIVEFNDGRNTDRLIQLLKKDKIIAGKPVDLEKQAEIIEKEEIKM